MTSISSQITKFLRDLSGSQSFELTFSYNEKEYTTVFRASHTITDGKEVIEVDNGCVNLTFGFMDGEVFQRDFAGVIQGENGVLGRINVNGETSCFRPKLTSDPRTKEGPRITAGDVLQTLKTKLALSFPVDGAPVQLVDGIRKERTTETGSYTMTSPFHIVRGGDAYYERFGYRSADITRLKEGIRSLTWALCTEPMKDIIQDCTEKEYDGAQLLTEIMREISWEEEVAYNENHPKSLSSTVFREYALAQGISMKQSHQWSFNNIWTFVLDADSADWKRYDAALIFTLFAPTASGGRRKFRKTRGKTRGKVHRKTQRNRKRGSM
jgi:hypothetical protein